VELYEPTKIWQAAIIIRRYYGVFELVFFLCRVETNLLKINKKSSTVFQKKEIEKDEKKCFYKLKKIIFVKFAQKRSAPKWATPKRATTNGPRKSGRAKKTCFRYYVMHK